jgi:hypothetical protein
MTSSRHWSTTGRLLSSEGVRQILWSFCWDPPVVSCCFLCQDYKACILEESATVLMKFQNLWCKHVLNSRYGAGIRWSMSPQLEQLAHNHAGVICSWTDTRPPTKWAPWPEQHMTGKRNGFGNRRAVDFETAWSSTHVFFPVDWIRNSLLRSDETTK